ncbi:hypothetical protein LMQ03_14305, partial [Staphylococcus aureus]|uniref:hypothetical protein n=1 Tax=Staphylococcus aureus TaxID=1280 RepID=UPI001E2F1016
GEAALRVEICRWIVVIAQSSDRQGWLSKRGADDDVKPLPLLPDVTRHHLDAGQGLSQLDSGAPSPLRT